MSNIPFRRPVGKPDSRLLGIFEVEVEEDNVPADVTLFPGQKLWNCAIEGCNENKKKRNKFRCRDGSNI